MSMEEVNAQLAAMMADDYDDGGTAPSASNDPPPSAMTDDEALRRAMDDDWDGSQARHNPVPAMGGVVERPMATTDFSMGCLTLPDAAAAALMPHGEIEAAAAASARTDHASGFYSLPSLDGDGQDEFMWPANGVDAPAPPIDIQATQAALAALAAADMAKDGLTETDGTEQWQGLACDIFQDPPLVPVGCDRYELPLGYGLGPVVVHPQRATFERAAPHAHEASGVGADSARVTGALLWDSAVVLAAYLTHRHGCDAEAAATAKVEAATCQSAARRRCIELGAGLGLPGLTAAALGMETTLTERAECLPLLRAGVAANGLEDTASVRELVWGDAAAINALGEPFDLILASDCIYEAEVIPSLVKTLVALLDGKRKAAQTASSRGGSEVLLAYDEAIGRPGAAAALRECAAAAQLSIEPLAQAPEAPPDRGYDASTWQMRWSKSSVQLLRLTLA